MHIVATFLMIALLFSSPAFDQESARVERVLHFTATSSSENIEEIATAIHGITEVQAAVDASQESLSLRGTAAQIALAEWMFTYLDQSISDAGARSRNGVKLEYQPAGGADDFVRLFYLTNPEVPRGLQEIAMAARAIADVPRMFTYNGLRAVAVRGTAEQVKAAGFLFAEMDQPAVARNSSEKRHGSASPELQLSAGPDNLVRVFYTPNTKTVRDFQEFAILVRTCAELRYVFTYNAPRAIGARGPAERLALADWMFSELDPETRPESTGSHQYKLSSAPDEVVRIYYLAHADTPEHLQATAVQIRSQTRSPYVFTYSASGALALRGTPEQIALADRLIEEREK